jgi:hypothetical protein
LVDPQRGLRLASAPHQFVYFGICSQLTFAIKQNKTRRRAL